MKKIKINQNGLTLLEILVALVILSIILISFISFFSQSAKFTQHNKQTLTAVQITENVVADVRKGKYKSNIDFSEGNYQVNIIIDSALSSVKLNKAIIIVKPISQTINAEFQTEMYFEVE